MEVGNLGKPYPLLNLAYVGDNADIYTRRNSS